MNVSRPLFAFLLVTALLFNAHAAFACGPFSIEAVFSFKVHPEFPLAKFAAGEIGILQPTLARSYLVVAYRMLGGEGFSTEEQKQLTALWAERMNYGASDSEDSWSKAWTTARKAVPGINPLAEVAIYRNREAPNEYETYVNCQRDAFDTAAETLRDRINKFGAASTAIKDWVEAQDEVFANCSEGDRVPAQLAANADPLLRRDRAYQTAAANFYAGKFAEAQKQFDAIAKDSASPWRQTAAYLAGRVLLRKASLGAAESKSETLTQAEEVFKKVLSDGTLTKVHPASRRLLKLVHLRLHPDLTVRELATSLMKRGNDNLKQDLIDYTILLDGFIGDADSEPRKDFPAALRHDDLTDWIVTIEAGDEASLNHALDRWHATSSPRWLLAALGKVSPNNPQTAALLASADKVDPQSSAFSTAAFHQIRLAIEAGKVDQARARLDEVLSRHKSQLTASSLNFFLGQRMNLATNLNEALKFAQRVPADFSWDEDGREMPADVGDDSEFKSLKGQPLFDLDGATLLNERLPLSVLQQATTAGLPAHLRLDSAQATWLRAVVLDDSRTAKEVAPTLKALSPAAAPLVDEYLAAQAEDARKFSGIFAWLKLPGLQPEVHAGIGRRSPLEVQDQYRDNWWCAGTIVAPESADKDAVAETTAQPSATPLAVRENIPSPSFLSEAEKAAAHSQHARLAALGPAPNYLCRQVIGWVERHPTDPRGPEALHLAVKTTRYGCTDKETRKWSKAAYDVLHKRFPGNPWTKKTPYWFKD